MRRSEINQFIHEAIEFFEESHFYLPEWILWSPAIWEKKGKAYDESRLNHLGWDVTLRERTIFGGGAYAGYNS